MTPPDWAALLSTLVALAALAAIALEPGGRRPDLDDALDLFTALPWA